VELSWIMKLRIAAAFATGAILIGILAWPVAAPPEPLGVVSLVAGAISLDGAITLAGLAFLAGLIAYFLSWPYGREIGILAVPAGLAQDVKMSDRQFGSVVGQPAIGQIAFGVFVSFGLAAFVVKKFANVGYIWPTIASALITAFTITTYVKQDTLQYLVQRWPTAFYSNTVISILPVQMVAFGTLGSIAGYWLAMRYNYWRKGA